MTRLYTTTLIAILLLAAAPADSAWAGGFDLRSALHATGFKPGATRKLDHRLRTKTIRAGIQVHRSLKTNRAPVKMPASKVLSNKTAAAKKYADSWTCRESTKLLLQKIGRGSQKLVLDSSGKGAFDWGAEGKVSFHYYAVDNKASPALLFDPTAGSNFANDARPGGMLHGMLREAGQRLRQPRAAERVARRLAKGGIDGMLILANQADIAVYKDALESAARLRTGMARDAQRE